MDACGPAKKPPAPVSTTLERSNVAKCVACCAHSHQPAYRAGTTGIGAPTPIPNLWRLTGHRLGSLAVRELRKNIAQRREPLVPVLEANMNLGGESPYCAAGIIGARRLQAGFSRTVQCDISSQALPRGLGRPSRSIGCRIINPVLLIHLPEPILFNASLRATLNWSCLWLVFSAPLT
jgi:hypothetical protein